MGVGRPARLAAGSVMSALWAVYRPQRLPVGQVPWTRGQGHVAVGCSSLPSLQTLAVLLLLGSAVFSFLVLAAFG